MTRLMRFGMVAIAWGWVATVWSTILSYRENPLANSNLSFRFDPAVAETVMGYGGFPMRVYAYPWPPMGPGSYQSALPLAINFVIWTFAVLLVIRLIGHRTKPGLEFAVNACTIGVAVVSTMIWILYMLFKFD